MEIAIAKKRLMRFFIIYVWAKYSLKIQVGNPCVDPANFPGRGGGPRVNLICRGKEGAEANFKFTMWIFL